VPRVSSDTYDFIIAGAGSAGCTLAARLAEDPAVSVCLVESGGSGRSPFVTMPAGNGFIFGNPKFDWGFKSVPQPGLDGRRIYYPRGKGLGGSSLLNGMIYIRGNARDFDHWRQLGLQGWSYADVLPYFKRAEGAAHRHDQYHGQEGPLSVSPAANFEAMSQRFIDAAQQAGARLNMDFNGASQAGVGRLDSTVHRGRRRSASAAYLSKRPTNLAVLTHTHVLGISLKNGRAAGLSVADDRGTRTLNARREIVSCLGAFGSPQLLMLSGIGPAEHLLDIGIEPLVDRAGVGESLYDHPNMPVNFHLREASSSLARFQRIDRAAGLALRYLFTQGGPGSGSFWSTTLFHSLRDPDMPELEVYFTPMIMKEEAAGAGFSIQNLLNLGRAVIARGKVAVPGVEFDINLLRPRSRGRVRLATADPRQSLLIDPAYFTEPADLSDFVAGVRHIREVAAQPPLRDALGPELSPGAACQTDAQITAAIRAEATTGHHPVSTCRMGRDNDPGAVLDNCFRVYGVEGLRVVDASAFPNQISGNPNAAIIMMAERAADMMMGRAPLPPEDTV